MKKLIIIFATLFFASCQNTQNQHGVVKIDDEKTEIIQQIFESVKKRIIHICKVFSMKI